MDRNEGIVAAYETGTYSYQQIADLYGFHFTTVGKILRKARGKFTLTLVLPEA